MRCQRRKSKDTSNALMSTFRPGCWWRTGEQTKIKAQQSHEIWVSKCLENERATFQASDIESNLRWTPDQFNASPCLQRFLDALPSGEYFGKGYQVVLILPRLWGLTSTPQSPFLEVRFDRRLPRREAEHPSPYCPIPYGAKRYT